jgi:Kef-type K+ transport system membrane component KefB
MSLAGPVAPLGGHQVLTFLLLVGLLLGLAVVLGQLARRFGLPSVVGELTAGVLVGPSVVGALMPGLWEWLRLGEPGQLHLVDGVGQLGVLLLVGLTGINVDLSLLRRKAGTVVWVGTTALLAPLAVGVAVGFALPATLVADGTGRLTFAAFVGVAMCVSSIPVIAKTLLEMRLMHRDVGQLIISTATVDDIVGWMLLSVVSAMATVGVRAGELLLVVGYLLALLAACVLVARPVVGPVLRFAVRSKDPGMVVAVTVLLIFGFSVGTHALGLEAVLGALLGGMVIGSSRWLDRERLAPLRTFVMAVLAPLFFATAGLRMDLTALGQPAVLVSGLVVLVLAVVGKYAGAYLGARTARLSHWESMALGAGLNARGAIEVIIAIVGLQLGVLTTAMYTIVVLVAIVTSLMAPPVLRYAARHIEETGEEHRRERRMAGADDPPPLRAVS